MTGKVRTIGVSLIPSLMWILIQAMVVLGFSTVMSSYGLSILIDLIVLIPAVAWFHRLPAREEKKEGGFFGISFRGVLFLLGAGVCLQLLVSRILMLLFDVFPELMGSYSQIMENLGMGSPTALSVAYTVLAAPVAEEMLFRGLTLRILEGAFPFWAANFLQALYFGIIHGNPVQGGYAFLAGMILGYLVKRKGTLAAGVLCHLGVNFSGIILSIL